MDPYLVLQVAPDADDVVIAAAYRALARRYHPDVAGEAATARMRKINAAWEVLRDPARRKAHDAARGGARLQEVGGRTNGNGHGSTAGAQPVHRRGPGGTGAAGRPPGRPYGSVLPFGRHIGWSLGEIARHDPGYLEWLDARPEGAPYRTEIDDLLRRVGWRRAPETPSEARRRGWFGRWGEPGRASR